MPLSAIERVEILTDGASSVYGTDAQAGVINIITRLDRPGLELTVDQRVPDHQKGQSRRADLSVGKGRLAHDGYSWYVTADLQNQQELLGRDRPYAAAGRYLIQQGGQDYWVYGPFLTAAQTSPTLATSKSGAWTRLWNADYQNGQCPQGKVPAWEQPACLYNTYADKGLFPAVKSAKLHAQGQLQLNEGMVAYAELSWKTEELRRSYNAWSQYSAKIGNTPGAPGYDLAVANGFDPAKGVWLRYNGSDLGVSSRWYELDTRRLLAGIRGQWQDWDFNGNYYFSDNRAIISTAALAAYPNLGVDANGVLTNSALLSPLVEGSTLTGQLQGMVGARKQLADGSSQLQGLKFKASRSIGEIDGRDVLLALGTDWRQELAQLTQYASGGTPSYTGQRNIWAQYAELQLPVVHAVEVLASLRNDQYSDFGRTTHGKLGAKWVPSEQWLLRGAWSTGFRAPAIAQMQQTGQVLASVAAVNCNAAVQTVATTLGGVCPASGNINVYSQGSSQLKPELSTQWNFGLRFSPDRNHSFSLDYWRLHMRDKISNYYDFIYSDPVRYIANFQLNANKELQIFAPMLNVGRTQTSGIDFAWALRRPTDWGQLHAGVSGTVLLTSKYQKADGEPFQSDLNRYSDYSGYVVPKLRTRWYLGLQQANWQWQATLNHVGSYNTAAFDVIEAKTGETVTLDNLKVPAWWTVDLMVMHQWSPQTSLRLGIDNVFNRHAPIDVVSYQTSFNLGTNPMLANAWGRTAHVSLTHRF